MRLGEPVKLLQCRRDVIFGTKTFIRRAAVRRTEDWGWRVDEGRPERKELQW